MTPKEKADQLVDRFYLSLPNNGMMSEGAYSCDNRMKDAKICALIAIDEMIRVTPWSGDIGNEIEDGSKEFYMKVKQEIEKL